MSHHNDHKSKSSNKESHDDKKHDEKEHKDKSSQVSYAAAADVLGFDKEDLLPKRESIEELHNQLNILEKNVDEHKEKWMRAFAELENTRRIAKRDITNAHKFALEKFASDLLPVADSIEQGLALSIGEGANAKALHDGLELTQKLFIDTMQKYGIEPINPLGETFNPEWHEAIGMEVSNEAKPNSILRVVQKGYLLNQRLIRPARVIVAKAG